MTSNLSDSQAEHDPLLNAKEIAAWLGVTEDWVWDHSTRRAPFLPAICLSYGALRFLRNWIAEFIDERKRPSAMRRKPVFDPALYA